MYMEFFFKYINSIEKNFSPRETHSKTDSIFPFESIKYIYIYETYLIIYLNFLPPTNIQQLSPFSLQSKQRSPLLGERKEKETAESILLISLITVDKCKTKEKEAYYYIPGRKRFVATKFLDSSSVDAVGIPPGNRRMT